MVKVKKLEEAPLLVNLKLEIKFKYLIETYHKMYSVSERQAMIFNISELSRITDTISAECADILNEKS